MKETASRGLRWKTWMALSNTLWTEDDILLLTSCGRLSSLSGPGGGAPCQGWQSHQRHTHDRADAPRRLPSTAEPSSSLRQKTGRCRPPTATVWRTTQPGTCPGQSWAWATFPVWGQLVPCQWAQWRYCAQQLCGSRASWSFYFSLDSAGVFQSQPVLRQSSGSSYKLKLESLFTWEHRQVLDQVNVCKVKERYRLCHFNNDLKWTRFTMSILLYVPLCGHGLVTVDFSTNLLEKLELKLIPSEIGSSGNFARNFSGLSNRSNSYLKYKKNSTKVTKTLFKS